MNSFMNLKIFATALVVTVLSGPIIQRLLPNWILLSDGAGPGGAWFISIMYHLVYGVVLAAGAALAAAAVRRMTRVLTIRGTAVASLVTVILFDVGFVVLAPKVDRFTYVALFLAVLSFIVHVLAAFIGVGRGLSRTPV